MAIEVEVIQRLREAIPYCESVGDRVSKNLFESILEDEEHHIDYLETQLELMNKLGEELYLAQCVSRPPGSTAG